MPLRDSTQATYNRTIIFELLQPTNLLSPNPTDVALDHPHQAPPGEVPADCWSAPLSGAARHSVIWVASENLGEQRQQA